MPNLLLPVLGAYSTDPIVTMDSNKLFIQSGINVVGGLSGEGKSTLLVDYCKQWDTDGYDVNYVNTDLAPNIGYLTLSPPTTLNEALNMFDYTVKNGNKRTILVIDSFKALCSTMDMDVDSNTHIHPFMLKIRQLVQFSKVTVILVHHVYKPKNVKTMVSSLYGSRAIEEQSDSAWILENNTARIVKSRTGLRRDEVINL